MSVASLPALAVRLGKRGLGRFLEFFTVNIPARIGHGKPVFFR